MQFKRNLLSAALASATLMLAATANAQTDTAAQDTTTQDASAPAQPKKSETQPTDLGTVQVTGIRRGIEAAIDVKRDSTSIVEAVSAEDIGKLPDSSIAESIARLPGLSAQRVAGRAQVISVRGLSPDFATTLLNGREVVSTGDNRSVEFDQYPSELMSGVVVYKTPDAGLVGQGLSGTIDMQTVRPLNFSAPVVVLNARTLSNSLGSAGGQSGRGNRLSASYIGQFADRTLGLAIGYAHSETPVQEEQVGLYEPWHTPNRPANPGDAPWTGVPTGTYISEGIKALRRTGRQDRDALMATLEYRPNQTWTSTLDVFYTKARQVDTANQFEVGLQYNGAFPCNPDCAWTQAPVNANGTQTGGTITNVYPLVRGMYNLRKDTIKAFGWSNNFNLGNVKLSTDLSYSKADRKELNLENNTQLEPSPATPFDTLNLIYLGNGFSQLDPSLDYSDPSKLYLRNTIYGSGYGKVPEVHDELKSARIGASFGLSGGMSKWFSDIEVGLNYADREKNKKQPEGNVNLGAQGDTPIASDLQYGLVDLGFAGLGLIPSWDVPAAVDRYMVFNPAIDQPYLYAKTWSLSEKLTTAYIKANLDAQLSDNVSLRGNIGVQLQRADQSSTANSVVTQGDGSNLILPTRLGKTYTDVLPSMNLAFMFPHEQVLRVALAKQVARPRVDQMSASINFGVDNGTGRPGGSGGNPKLDPWRANAFDISYEKYFGDKAYVAAAYFYKKLTSYIYQQTVDGYDWSAYIAGYVPPTPPPGQTFPPIQATGNFTAPMNGKGGTLRGLELTASLPFEMMTPALRGFGLVASASFNDSNIKILAPEASTSVGSGPIDLPGLSKRVYNVTLYYERNGFEARVSQRRRSDFIGEIGNFNGARTLRYVVGENITDAQIGYTFSDASSLKGLSIQLQGQNLTDSPYRTYAETRDRPLEYIKWGRTYLLGVTYKF